MIAFESSDEAWRAEMHRLLVGLPATADAVVAHWHARPEFHRPRGPIKLQAKHIPDETFLAIIANLVRPDGFRGKYASLYSDFDVLMMPKKVVRAKARALIRRGLITGCVCGCRGSLELTEAGWALLPDAGVRPGQPGVMVLPDQLGRDERGGFRAECSCGWKGTAYWVDSGGTRAYADARADRDDHALTHMVTSG